MVLKTTKVTIVIGIYDPRMCNQYNFNGFEAREMCCGCKGFSEREYQIVDPDVCDDTDNGLVSSYGSGCDWF